MRRSDPTKESGDTITAKGQRERLYELMRERAEKAETERDALREALEPFALPLADRQVRRGYVSARLLVSDIRRARAALERLE